MPEEKTVDIETSGPGAEISLQEEKKEKRQSLVLKKQT